MKLTSTFLFKHWTSGKIIGFISRSNVYEALRNAPDGTFLMRFSESVLGAITLSVKCRGQITMIQPWTAKDLSVRSLDLIIQDLHNDINLNLKWLYFSPMYSLASVLDAFPIKSFHSKL